MIRTGQGLIDKKQCQGAEEVVSQRLTTIGDQWEYLVQKSTEKSMKLKEASKQQVSNAICYIQLTAALFLESTRQYELWPFAPKNNSSVLPAEVTPGQSPPSHR